jgi:asparagine synthase (glutamine-hydrolysing)
VRVALREGGRGGADPLARLAGLLPDGADTWQLVTRLELVAYMEWRLLRDTDVMSMAHSLEVRVPFVDHKVVEFVCGLPLGWQTRWGFPKRLLVESVKDLLPAALLGRPKQGFSFPLEHWMRGALAPVVRDTLSPDAVRARGWLDPAEVDGLVREFFEGRRPYTVIWSLVMLELWARRADETSATRVY